VKTKDHPHLKAKEPAQLNEAGPKASGKDEKQLQPGSLKKTDETAEEISFKGYHLSGKD
jgi:hypothetical protein